MCDLIIIDEITVEGIDIDWVAASKLHETVLEKQKRIFTMGDFNA